MHNIKQLLTGIAAALMVTGTVMAAGPSLSARMEQPKSPTGSNNVEINVVVLDTEGRLVDVQCYKKAPLDSGFFSFGSPITVNPAGGNNTAHCQAAGVFAGNGTYQFYAIASAGGDTATTGTVSVEYDTSGPGTPTNYNKEKIGSCSYKITFHTADDAGKTVKVIIFRSSETSFNLDSGTMIGTVNIGSNLDGSFTNTPPNCEETYYYELRAFDAYGNGSGVVGDSITVTTSASEGASGTTGGAIPAGTGGNVLGATGSSTGETAGEVMGEAAPSPTQEIYNPPAPSLVSGKTATIAGAAVVLLILAWYLRKKGK
jgi:hypothetical protein